MRKLVILLILVTLIGQTQARPNGIDSTGNNGCVCHGAADDSTSVNLEGLPEIYNTSATYQLTLSIDSEVEANNPQGGFRIIVSHGILSGEVVDLDGGYTHNESTNNQRSWNLTWTAPESSEELVTFTVHANAVNGNEESTGDEWNSNSYAVPGPDYEGDIEKPNTDFSASSTQKIVAAIGLIAVISLVIIAVRD